MADLKNFKDLKEINKKLEGFEQSDLQDNSRLSIIKLASKNLFDIL